jgi:hypothetical protein
MAKKEKLPKTNATEIEGLIERLKGSQLKPGDAELIERLLRTVVMLLDLLERKNHSIKKLKSMIFGPRTERRQTRELAEGEKSAKSETLRVGHAQRANLMRLLVPAARINVCRDTDEQRKQRDDVSPEHSRHLCVVTAYRPSEHKK